MGDNNTFTVVLTKTRYEALREYARGQGITAGQHGEITAHGVRIAYSISPDYHPTDGSTEVDITVLHKPIFIPEGMVEKGIHDFIDDLPNAPEKDSAPTVPHTFVGDPEAQVDERGNLPGVGGIANVAAHTETGPADPVATSELSGAVQEGGEAEATGGAGQSGAATLSEFDDGASHGEKALDEKEGTDPNPDPPAADATGESAKPEPGEDVSEGTAYVPKRVAKKK